MSEQIGILAIDGGGISGIIPARILAEMEEVSGQPIARMFDLIAGTSTGGILALGLTKPDREGNPQYSARELVKLYQEEGGTIFSRSVWHWLRALGVLEEEQIHRHRKELKALCRQLVV